MENYFSAYEWQSHDQTVFRLRVASTRNIYLEWLIIIIDSYITFIHLKCWTKKMFSFEFLVFMAIAYLLLNFSPCVLTLFLWLHWLRYFSSVNHITIQYLVFVLWNYFSFPRSISITNNNAKLVEHSVGYRHLACQFSDQILIFWS